MTAISGESAMAAKPGRIDRSRFDTANFPSVMELPVRFADLDVLWHVNNVAVISLLQEARVHFNREMSLPSFKHGHRSVVAAMNVEYAGELNFPGMVEIATGILGLGRTSFTVAQMISQNGQAAVYSQVTMVVTGDSGAAPLPEAMRAAMERRCMIPG